MERSSLWVCLFAQSGSTAQTQELEAWLPTGSTRGSSSHFELLPGQSPLVKRSLSRTDHLLARRSLSPRHRCAGPPLPQPDRRAVRSLGTYPRGVTEVQRVESSWTALCFLPLARSADGRSLHL